MQALAASFGTPKQQVSMLSKTSFILAVMAATSFAAGQRQTYIIHMDEAKIKANGNSALDPNKWYNQIMDSITKISAQELEQEEDASSPKLLYVYEKAIFGFCAKLSSTELESLKKTDGFLSAIPDELVNLHTTHTPHFLGLQYGNGLWQPSNLASDVIIGLIDTGIWPEHKSFSDHDLSPVPVSWKGACEKGTQFSPSNCNRKLIGARFFLKAYESKYGRINETDDYRSARDFQGHGTHTASIAAGSVVNGASLFGSAAGRATGMRFTSRIAAYKACWQQGCFSSDILAAIDTAVSDGVDMLSLSLGSHPRPYYNDSMAIASFGAFRNGIFVSFSAGNLGPLDSTVTNIAPWIMTVAASSTDRSLTAVIKLGNSKIMKGESLHKGKPTKQLPLVYGRTAGKNQEEAELCKEGSLSPALVAGKIVACRQGGNRAEKGEQVKLAGGAAMIILNNEQDGEDLFVEPHVLPAVSLGLSAAKALENYAKSSIKPTASINFLGTQYHTRAPAMAALSSRGPSLSGPDLIKPDITAPGLNILAAWPPVASPNNLESNLRSTPFNMLSGTSMACPHVTGIAALIKSVHKNWSPAAIKSALMTTAYTLDNKNCPISDHGHNYEKATPLAFGSGHVFPEKASQPGLIYDITVEDYLNYLCSLNYTSEQIALVSRSSNFTCPINLPFQPGDLNYPSFSVLIYGNATNFAATYRRTVTNVGDLASTYRAHVTAPEGILAIVKPRVLKFKSLQQKLTYKVTFIRSSGMAMPRSSSFGSLVWVSKRYTVRSPIAITSLP